MIRSQHNHLVKYITYYITRSQAHTQTHSLTHTLSTILQYTKLYIYTKLRAQQHNEVCNKSNTRRSTECCEMESTTGSLLYIIIILTSSNNRTAEMTNKSSESILRVQIYKNESIPKLTPWHDDLSVWNYANKAIEYKIIMTKSILNDSIELHARGK